MARGKRSSSLYFMPVWVVMIYWGVAKTIERGSISIECISCFIYILARKILPQIRKSPTTDYTIPIDNIAFYLKQRLSAFIFSIIHSYFINTRG